MEGLEASLIKRDLEAKAKFVKNKVSDVYRSVSAGVSAAVNWMHQKLSEPEYDRSVDEKIKEEYGGNTTIY